MAESNLPAVADFETERKDKKPVAERAPASGSKSSFLSHAVVYGLSAVSLQLVSFLLIPLYAEKLSVPDYGLLNLLYRVGDVINICLMVNGLQQAAISMWGNAQTVDDRRSLAPSVVAFTAMFLAAGTGLILFISPGIASWLEVDDWRLLACGSMAMMLQAATVMPLALMQARFESTAYAIVSVTMAICQILMITAAVVIFDGGIWGIILAFGLNNAIFSAILNGRELLNSGGRPSVSHIGDLARFSLPFIPGGLCFFVLHNGDQFFLKKFHDDGFALGVYGLSYRITKGVVMFASQPLCQVWNSWMYSAYQEPDREAIFGRAVTRIMAILTWASVIAIVFRDELIVMIRASKFVGASELLAPLLLAHFFLILSNLSDGAFYVTRRTDLKPYIAFAAAVVMTIAYALLIPRYAAMGAAVATLIGFVFLFGATAWVGRQTFAIGYEWGRLAALLATAGLTCGLAFPLGSSMSVWPVKLLLVLSNPIFLWWSGLIRPEEKAYVGRLRDKFWTYLGRSKTAALDPNRES